MQNDDGYVPLLTRFRTWWDDDDPKALSRKGLAAAAGTRAMADADAIEVDGPTTPLVAWPPERIAFCRRLWGHETETVSPGGVEYALRLARPMALGANASILDLNAGLGGGARKIAKELGPRVTGMEADPDLAEAANLLSKTQRMSKTAPIAHYDPLALDLPERKFEGVLLRELLYRAPDRMRLLRDATQALKPRGHLVFTDFVLADGAARASTEAQQWLEREPETANPGVMEEYRPLLKALKMDVRVHSDETPEYIGHVLSAWSIFVDSLNSTDLTRDFVNCMMREAEFWLARMRALESGKLRLLRVHAMKKS